MPDRIANLIVRLQDKVSGPARAAAAGLGKIKTAMKGIGGMGGGDRLDAMIARNNKRIGIMRSRMLDAGIAAYALKRAIDAPINAAMEFESSMADVKKVVEAFGSDDTFGKFQQAIKELSREVPRSVKELSQIAAAAGQAGLPHDEIVEFTRQVAMISTAFELSTEETGRTLARLKSALKLTVPGIVLLADHMNVLANNMATSEGEVMEVVRRVGALADKSGLATKNVAALGAAMNSSGVDADVAATAIRNMLLNTTGIITKNAAGAMRTLGFDPDKFKTLVADKGIGAYRELFQRIAKLKNEDQAGVLQKIFGKRAVDALGPLMNNLDNFDKALKLVADDAKNAGAAQREFETRSETFSAKLQMFNNRVTEMSINIGDALLPALTSLMETLGPIVSKIAEWATQNQDLVVGVVALSAGLIALGIGAIGFGYIGALMKGSLLGISKVVTTLLPILGKLRTAFMFTGVGLVIAAIAMAGTWIYNNWSGLTEFFAGFGDALSEAFGPVKPLLDPVVSVFNKVTDAISSMLGPLDASDEKWRAWGTSAGEGVAMAIKVIAALPEFIALEFDRAIETLSSYTTSFFDAGSAIGTSLWDGLKSIFSSIISWITAKAEAIYAPIAGIAGRVKGAFSSVGSFFGGGKSSTPGGARKKGGSVSRGGSYIVGETQAEIFEPTRSGTISPSVGGSTNSVNFSPSFVFHGVGSGDAAAITDQVRAVLRDEVREAFRGVFADTGVSLA